MTTELHLKDRKSYSTPSVKPIPQSPEIPVPFLYWSSNDGTDENLLIILHGLGRYASLTKKGFIDACR